MTRRDFIRTTTVLTTATAGGLISQPAKAAARHSQRLIDTNVTLLHWPFRRLPLDETSRLVAKLRSHEVTQAWAGRFDGLLHKNMAAVNARLGCAMTERAVHDNHRRDVRLWALMQRMRRIDSRWQRSVRRRPYPSLTVPHYDYGSDYSPVSDATEGNP